MPTISPLGRPQVGGTSEEATPRRSTVTASTGMNLPGGLTKNLTSAASTPPQKTGQPGITEETPAPAVTLSPQLTALARKEQKFQQTVQAQRDKEAQWEKEKADFVPKSAFKAKLQQNAAEALKDLGTDYEEIARLLIEQANGADPVRDLRSEVDQLKKSQEESTNKLFDATVNQYRTEAKKLVETSDKYLVLREELNEPGSEAMEGIIAEFLEDWEKTGETKDISYYVDLAEEGLRDIARSYKARLEKIEKPAPEETAPAKKTLPPPKTGTRTLTQQVETTPVRTTGQFQHLSMKERIAQSIARASK